VPVVAVVASAIVLALAFRHDPPRPGKRRVIVWLAALALAVRLVTVAGVFFVASRTHGEGTWLNDEASFFLATEALEHSPFDRSLPSGLDHLGGDGYLGLTTWLSAATGVADTNTFRVTNAALGTMAVVLSALVARRLFGTRVAVIAGLVLCFWPALVLWSATMLRDTLGGLTVVIVWWSLGQKQALGLVRWLGLQVVATVLLLSLRPYLAVAVAVGVVAWLAYPWFRRRSRTHLACIGAGIVAVVLGAVVIQPRRLDFAAHELLYRQTVTRMETLGRLYFEVPPDVSRLPIRPGTAVAVADPATGWLSTGVLQDFSAPDVARIAFTDESIRDVPLADVMLLQSAPIPPLQLLAFFWPDLLGFLGGSSTTADANSPVWVANALLWDVLACVALVAAWRTRVGLREWLFPLCVVGGTVLALVAIPGAPGNADRHRTTQTVPLLVVLACGLAVSRREARALDESRVVTTISNAASEPTAALSRTRSAR
jgi:hypothetical protein